jgi:hypothetical protein
MNIGVHTSHCCAKHGCKYGNAECPVVLGTHKQEFPCEDCEMEAEQLKEQADYLANNREAFLELLDAMNNTHTIECGVQFAVMAALDVLRPNAEQTKLMGPLHD